MLRVMSVSEGPNRTVVIRVEEGDDGFAEALRRAAERLPETFRRFVGRTVDDDTRRDVRFALGDVIAEDLGKGGTP